MPAAPAGKRAEAAVAQVTPGLLPAVPIEPGTFVPKPFHWRYLQALSELLEENGIVNQNSIAKKLGLSRQAIWKMHRKYPQMRHWVNEQMSEANRAFVGPVLRKMAVLGMRGSEAHAKLYLSALGELKGSGGGDGDQPAAGKGPTIVNIAIPRPDGGPAAVVQVRTT